jgi:microcin C transport system substrate-binding protein
MRTYWLMPLGIVVVGALMLGWLIGCGGGGGQVDEVAFETVELPPGADPSVPAELGGAGFSGEGWLTNADFPYLADPNAKKGGSMTMRMVEFPSTLRTEGKDANTTINSLISSMTYERLLSIHPTTLEFIPSLATHWKISDDKQTFWFRINPDARWATGHRVTAQDVIETWRLHTDEGILAPYTNILYQKYEEPVAESPYIVRVHCKELNWRHFIYFGISMAIFPSHILKDLTGEQYLKEYQFKLLPGSGPYTLDPKDIVKGTSLTLKRRDNYWGKTLRKNIGSDNFDRFKFIVIQDERLALEKFKKGEFDIYYISRASWWVDEFGGNGKGGGNIEDLQRGLIQKRKIYNDNPQGIVGYAFNMRVAPFDDIRIRKAFYYLFNRDKLIDKLFLNEYEYLNSYFPGKIYENPNNLVYEYDQEKGVKLLAEAGWKERNEEGWLVNDGQVFELTLAFASPSMERIFTVYQEDLAQVGIKLNLKQSTGATMFKMVNERNFKIHFQNWTGLLFPNPESSFHSNTADPDNTTNITGVKNARIDEICAEYNVTFDQKKREKQIQEIDGILADLVPYALGWYAPFNRIAYWNKFGHPEYYLTRIGDYLDIPQLWWYNEEKAARLEEARKDKSIQLEVGETMVTYWPEYDERMEELRGE